MDVKYGNFFLVTTVYLVDLIKRILMNHCAVYSGKLQYLY